MERINSQFGLPKIRSIAWIASVLCIALMWGPGQARDITKQVWPDCKWNCKDDSFKTAKEKLMQIYSGFQIELYCAMTFDGDKKIKNHNGFETDKYEYFENDIQWDHAAPAKSFGWELQAWQRWDAACTNREGSYKWRDCARKTSLEFRRMEADMYNLFPANGAINVMRGEASFGDIPWEERHFGTCDIEFAEIDWKDVLEPRDEAKWIIARATLYMDTTYPTYRILSPENKALMEAWNSAYPVQQREVNIADQIEKIQWNRNPFIVWEKK